MMKRLATIACGGLLAAGALTASTAPAGAAMADIAPDRIGWSSMFPCSDGNAGAYADGQFVYTSANGGYHRLRMAMYTREGARLFPGPQREINTAGAGYRLPSYWTTGSSAYRGEVELVAFVHRWNGSQWALVARETMGCL